MVGDWDERSEAEKVPGTFDLAVNTTRLEVDSIFASRVACAAL